MMPLSMNKFGSPHTLPVSYFCYHQWWRTNMENLN